jgi:hypothetical protein
MEIPKTMTATKMKRTKNRHQNAHSNLSECGRALMKEES